MTKAIITNNTVNRSIVVDLEENEKRFFEAINLPHDEVRRRFHKRRKEIRKMRKDRSLGTE